MVFRCIVHKVVFFCAINFFCSAVFSTELSFDQAIGIVRGLEKQVETLYWKASVEQKFYGYDSAVTIEGKFQIEAFFDPSRRFYNVMYVSLPPNDVKDASEARHQLAFGGNQYTFLDHGLKQGGITNNRTDSPLSHLYTGLLFSQDGLLPGLPNIFSFMGSTRRDGRADLLSSFLSDWKVGKIQFSINEEGVLNVIAEVKLENTANCPTTVTLFYDTRKGGIITNADVKYRRPGESGIEQEIELCRWMVEARQNSDGKWIPSKTTYKEFISTGQLFATLEATFESVEINPSINSNHFVLSMPDGYYVDDFIQKLRYKVGTPIDEDRAIEKFMNKHGFTGDMPQRQRGNYIRYILMGTGVILIFIGLYRLVLKRRK